MTHHHIATALLAALLAATWQPLPATTAAQLTPVDFQRYWVYETPVQRGVPALITDLQYTHMGMITTLPNGNLAAAFQVQSHAACLIPAALGHVRDVFNIEL